jgi:membrane fusion protein (multidrug efflux system)
LLKVLIKRIKPWCRKQPYKKTNKENFLVVDTENKVKQRHVELGRRIHAMWAVESGLELGESVIVEGLQKVRAGVEVKGLLKKVDPLTGTITDAVSSSNTDK